ncbi:DUF4974 domain-containing protein [Pedobacter sp. MC2016-14]|uniref:FecR family protein n=1 Tax=Pedobacter sp. MC2016-14 TaxID=2897327 RepID=UPI001E3DFBA0|nr:FecR family protein [Pedobacter sp. MC2016-14]MCD0488586.1 DUF4974 domain-containing protein [Pedobacter sp. MC2016-14]
MSDYKERFDYLLDKYINKACSWEEYQELFSHIEKSENKDFLFQFMDQKHIMAVSETEKTEQEWDNLFKGIQHSTLEVKRSYPWYKMMVAAVVLIIGGIGYHLITAEKVQKQATAVAKVQDIAPGTNKAVLTMADGSVVLLDKNENRVLSQKGNNVLTRTANGQLVYDGAAHEAIENAGAGLNTLATPRGGQYEVVLPDGSKVFLNAASSLKYPTAFSGKFRKVILTGEAYFEISKNKDMPFIVEANKAEIKVLGTHFNVMTYAEENFSTTTLLEGSVQFSRNSSKYILKPGQQVKYQPNGSGEKVEKADVESVMAWRKGIFVFDNTGIEEIMRSVTRWYNVDVVYKGSKPNIAFTGVIPRATNLSKVLKVLETTGDLTLSIDGNKIICSKK